MVDMASDRINVPASIDALALGDKKPLAEQETYISADIETVAEW
jgi:hypothetical protein